MLAIESTTDYKQFKLIMSNREVGNRHIRELIGSFEDFPELSQAIPIIVNEKMEVIDGQHRLQVCEALGRPVYYVVVPGASIQTAQLLNSTHQPWTVMDFAYSYAKSGNWHYQKLLDLHEQYPIAISALIIYASEKRKRNMHVDFRMGEFKIADNFIRVKDKLDKLSDFSDFPYWNSYSFSLAFHRIVNTEGYDHARMMSKMEGVKLTKQPGILDYLRLLEEVYNRHMTIQNHLRFWGVN